MWLGRIKTGKFNNLKSTIFHTIFGVLFICICILYLYKNYKAFTSRYDSIEIEFNQNVLKNGTPILYAFDNNSPDVNYAKPYRFKKINDSTVILSGLLNENISKFRIYFEAPGKDFYFKQLVFLNNKTIVEHFDLSHIKRFDKLKIKKNGEFEVKEVNGYIELPYLIVYKLPFWPILLTFILLTMLFVLILKEVQLFEKLQKLDRKYWLLVFYLVSIYTVQPIYNVALILGTAVYIRKFKVRLLISNKVNVLILGFFLLYFLNSILNTHNEATDFSTVERFLPFVFIPIFLNSCTLKDSLYYVMSSGLIIAFGLFAISCIDYTITGNLEYFSFDNFSKYYHPVYVSYLLFLSIFYLKEYDQYRRRGILQLVCFGLMLFLGSKQILFTTIILYSIFYINFKQNWKLILSGAVALIIIFTLFKPLQKRFTDVINYDDMSVLREENISPNDSRINGLTLRLILWREAIATMDNWKEYLFGNGVSKSKAKDLYYRMENLGLKGQSKYNPHNQFVDTFWRTGLIGLLILLGIPFVGLKHAIKRKNKLLMAFCLFMIFAMLTESVFGRVRGVYFFTTVIIILTNNFFYNESRNYWNTRNSK